MFTINFRLCPQSFIISHVHKVTSSSSAGSAETQTGSYSPLLASLLSQR